MHRTMWLLPLLTAACLGREPVIKAQGTIEVEETDVVSMVEGRVSRIWVEEGATVRAGDTVVTLVSTSLPDDLRQREARVAEARAALADLVRGARAEEITRAEAELRAAITSDSSAARDLARIEGLVITRAASPQDADRAGALAAEARGRREAKEQSLALLKAGATAEALQAARSRLAEAEANLAGGRATWGELTLVAPVSGVVLPRYYREGEVVAAGRPVLTIAEVSRPWIRVYVNQRDLPGIRVGQGAAAALDGDPSHPIPARIVAINHEAEYTPRVALTLEERADLMFGVKLVLDDSLGRAHAGLPATVRLAGTQATPAQALGAR